MYGFIDENDDLIDDSNLYDPCYGCEHSEQQNNNCCGQCVSDKKIKNPP